MYDHSELFLEVDGSPMPITTQELAAKVGEIPGDGVSLRLLCEEDAEPYFNLIDFDRDHLSQFGDITSEKYQTVEDVRKSIVNTDDDNYNPFKLRFGIWDNGVMVGSINLTPGEKRTAEIGYWVGKQYIGHGFAPKAVDTLSEFAFNGLGYTKLDAEVERDNKASTRALEKSGFLADSIRGYEYAGGYKGPKHNRVFIIFSKNKPSE